MFEPYKDINGDSGVEAYEIGTDYISVRFRGTPKVYTYNYLVTGRVHVEHMKALAKKGDGLNAYINLYCKYDYVGGKNR